MTKLGIVLIGVGFIIPLHSLTIGGLLVMLLCLHPGSFRGFLALLQRMVVRSKNLLLLFLLLIVTGGVL